MPEPKIVAFLQNMWVRDPARVKLHIEKYGEEYRLRFIEYALFAGCLTGRRLEAAFGEELCNQIIWEEASREIGSYAASNFPPDREHIKKVLDEQKPDLVLCFTSQALTIIGELVKCPMIVGPHPANRRPDINDLLRNVKRQIEKFSAKFRKYEKRKVVAFRPKGSKH